jgi:PD-(D/E)XK endonuclease
LIDAHADVAQRVGAVPEASYPPVRVVPTIEGRAAIPAKRTPKSIGENSEGQVLAAFLRAGEVVLLPFGDNQRYDMVLDRDGVFWRVQVKTGRLRNGSVIFSTVSNGSDTGHREYRHYRGAADFFAVYCPDTDKVYLIRVDDCGDRGISFRIDPTRQMRGIRWARDYEYPGGSSSAVRAPA